MELLSRLKKLNNDVSEATEDINLMCFLPLLLYIVTFFVIDLFYCRIILIEAINYPWDISLGKIIGSNLIALSALIFLLPKNASAVVFAVIASVYNAYGFSQYCYSSQDNNLFRLETVSVMGEGMKYMSSILKNMPAGVIACFIGIFLLTAAVTFVTIKLVPTTNKKRGGLAHRVKAIFGLVIFIPSAVLVASIPSIMDKNAGTGYGSYNAYNYREFLNAVDLYDDTDIFMLLQRDIVCSIKSKFTCSGAQGIEQVDDYFASRPEHTSNDKTDIFKGKNLICVMMETLDYAAVTEEYCPNITRLMNEGISFTNFYSVRFGDAFTFGTEYCVNTGLSSVSGSKTPTDENGSPFPLSLGFLFRNNGYTANEFHYNDPSFYNRGNMSRIFGYENYCRYEDYAQNKNQNFEVDDTLVTDDGLYERLTLGEHFLDYVVTYSAHMPYDTDDELYLEAIRRHPEFAVTDSSDTEGIFKAKASLTDDMVGELAERLDEDGLLDDTVLLFFADHYCPAINDEDNDVLACNTPCFIYTKGITPEKVDKVCNTTDILPTIVNMFGVGNSDDYTGYDIFSDSYEGYAFFPNLSWITSEGMFIQGSGVQSADGGELSEEYISRMNDIAESRLEINRNIVAYDYYRRNQGEE